MTYQLKSFFSPALVKRLASDISRVHPAFPAAAFVKQACSGLGKLELLDRGRHIGSALAAHLPADYPAAIDVLIRSLGPEHETDELIGLGMAPFYYLPHLVFVTERGLDHFELSMRAQYELTKRFSAESSIRPYIARDPERTFRVLTQWTRDPNAHVRRLASEGTRLRLPWAMRVAWLDANPERVLALLELLKDDPATLVRRSVANSLNDLAKVRPDLLIRTCSAWLDHATPERRALVEHALRSAVKRGDAGALRILGYGKNAAVSIERVQITPRRATIGGRVLVRFRLASTSKTAQDLVVDMAVHFVKRRGHAAAKVFKVARVTLPPGARVTLDKTVSLAVHTTRVPRPGRHAVDVVVNGKATRVGSFEVRDKRAT